MSILLEQYILEAIYQQKLEEGMSDFLPKTRLEGTLQAGILGLLILLGKKMKDNNEISLDTPPKAVAERVVDVYNKENRNNALYGKTRENAQDFLEDNLEEITIDELYKKYRNGEINIQAFNDSENQQASNTQLEEMFFNYMKGTYKDYFVADFNEMSKEDFDYIVDQYETFLDNNAFKFTNSEYNQAMSLAFLLSSCDHYNLDSNKIKGYSDRLEAVHGALHTIEHLSENLPDPSQLAITQNELEETIIDLVNGQIEKVKELRNNLAENYDDAENEDKIAMYDDMILQIEGRFQNTFGFELMKKR